MPLSMDSLAVGEVYDRKHLANLWGYRDWHALSKGIVTPAHDTTIVLFVTKDKQEANTQYRDYFDGDVLFMEGETKGTSDQRLINSGSAGDSIYLFYRGRHHQPFTYYGEVTLLAVEQGRAGEPSKFSFATRRREADTASSLRTERTAHGAIDSDTAPDAEGLRRLRIHVEYERSLKNRTHAIAIHGTDCSVCGFNIDTVFGPDFARGFIEIHHVKPLASNPGPVDPEKDLVPLCSNCHSMAHHRRDTVVGLAELKALIIKQRALSRA